MSRRFPGRRFSVLRLSVLVLVLAVVGALGYTQVQHVRDSVQAASSSAPWFAAYVDATATPAYAMESATGDGTAHTALSFIVADGAACSPSWGGFYDLDEAAGALDLDRRLARMEDEGRDLIVSFGGLLNDELALACDDPAALAAAYREVIDRYDLSTIDLDLENEGLSDPEAVERRSAAVAELQRGIRADGGDLAVWLTLPVAPAGLTQEGLDAVTSALDAGVDVAGVNVMTMNFGGSREDDETMGEASIRALESTHRQLDALYDDAGTPLGALSLWRKIGATPMLGQNDVAEDVFTLDDAAAVNVFAVENGLGRVSLWSANRDKACSANVGDTTRVSDSCSGVEQELPGAFAAALSADLDGSPNDSAGAVTESEPESLDEIVDDPATSPYPIWSDSSSYPAGTKIVWHRYVYEAKWWTQGDVPDDPVAAGDDTPWTIIGPVLEGERPVPSPELPAGFYPAWDPSTVYTAGQRVMLDQSAFQARWWNEGESPESSYADPGNSAWTALDDSEIRRLLVEADQDRATPGS